MKKFLILSLFALASSLAFGQAQGTTNQPVPAAAIQVGGSDGTNMQAIKVNSSGAVLSAATDGANVVTNQSASATNLTAATNNGAQLMEKGHRWSVVSAPAAGSQATASKAAGGAGVRHVVDCVTMSAGAATAPTATVLTINLRDGATGAGTIIWTTQITAAATAANHGNVSVCGLNLTGSANTAMTLEFSAGLTSEAESVTITGYDVN